MIHLSTRGYSVMLGIESPHGYYRPVKCGCSMEIPMRITKKMVRDAKHGMENRIVELCNLLRQGSIQEELARCFSEYGEGRESSISDAKAMRILLMDLVERAVPTHWTD